MKSFTNGMTLLFRQRFGRLSDRNFVFAAFAVSVTAIGLSGCLQSTESYGGSSYDPTPGGQWRTVANQLLGSADLVMRVELADVVENGSDQVTQVTNQVTSISGVTGTLNLTPATTGMATLSQYWLSLTPAGAGFLKTPDASGLAFNDATVVAVISNASRGTVLALHPTGDRTTNTYELTIDGSDVKSRYVTTGGSTESTLDNSLNESLVVVAAFNGLDTNKLSVNGALNQDGVVTGTPAASASGPRVISLGAPAGGDTSHYKELYVFNRELTNSEMGAMIRFVADRNNITNLTIDPALNVGGTTADPLFLAAQQVVEQRCLACHAEWTGATRSSYIALGMVVPGNLAASPLYYWLQTATSGPGPRSMPTTGALSPAETAAIADWITSLQ